MPWDGGVLVQGSTAQVLGVVVLLCAAHNAAKIPAWIVQGRETDVPGPCFFGWDACPFMACATSRLWRVPHTLLAVTVQVAIGLTCLGWLPLDGLALPALGLLLAVHAALAAHRLPSQGGAAVPPERALMLNCPIIVFIIAAAVGCYLSPTSQEWFWALALACNVPQIMEIPVTVREYRRRTCDSEAAAAPQGFALAHLLATSQSPSQSIDPRMYLKAQSEVLAVTLVVSSAITTAVRPEVFSDNPIFNMMGYNNPCVAWDYNPAKCVACVLFSLSIYFAVRYTATASLLLGMTETRRGVRRCVRAVNVCFAVSAGCLGLIFVVTPEDGTLSSLRLHMGFFVQYIFFRYLAVAANWLHAPAVTRGQWAFIVLSGLSTCAELWLGLYVMASYENQGVKVVPPAAAQLIDWAWFATLPLTSLFIPATSHLHAEFAVVEHSLPGGAHRRRAAAPSPRQACRLKG